VGVSRPNVLIVMADQFRADCVEANGSAICRTPNLDRLAAGGVTFSRAYTTAPLCTPARGALFTGRYPHSNRLTANTQYPECPTPRLPDEERLVFQHLAAAGYRCGYTGKWHLNVGEEAAEAHRRGVADFFNGAACRRLQMERLGLPPREDVGRAAQRIMRGDHPPMSGVIPYPEPYQLDSCIAGQTVELIRRYTAAGMGAHEGEPSPWALVCSFHGPHFPIEVPEPYESMYDPQDVPRPASFDDTFEGKPQGQRTHPWLQLAAHLSWEEWRRVIAHYWGFCTYIDSLVGRVLNALEESGQGPDTLVMFTADHGEMAGHHRMFDKGPYLYEDVMRVPFVWRWPETVRVLAPRGRQERLVSHVDVVPTVLEVAGVGVVEGSPGLQGQSLLKPHPPAPSPEAGEGEAAVFGETNVGDRVNPQQDTRLIVAGGWKYVYRPDEGPDELYDLQNDPDEMRNVIGESQAQRTLATLRARLREWMERTEDTLAWSH